MSDQKKDQISTWILATSLMVALAALSVTMFVMTGLMMSP